ncbi:MAG TPA: isoprenylcysteine carboxylmethyltransferase family protein [Gemmataceae bacterium]|nr:isoprenylcysteine carboxylmethyltransferase family protein [Gemmataceae bacterium]
MSAAKAVAVVCYLVALGGTAAFAGLVLLLGLDLRPDPVSLAHPWFINVGWLLVFGLQHSGMVRAGWKRVWTRVVPSHLERSVYAALSGLILAGMALTWQPLVGDPAWCAPRGLVVLPLMAAVGLAWVSLRFDHLGLFGIRQAWEQGREPAADHLLVVGPYRFVRHPLMACLLAFLWTQPVMPPALLLLSGGLTAYILLGVLLEERDLRRRFGPAYADYRRRVPMFLPWRRPAPPATYRGESA